MAPDAATLQAVSSALGQWNTLKATSGVEFDPLPAGRPALSADLQIQLTTDSSGNTGGCASYRPSTGRVYYGATFQQAAKNGNGSTIIAHELGHSLGLDDAGTSPTPASIMNNPSNTLPSACTNPAVPTTTVQPSDAAAIPTCTKQAQKYLQQMYLRSKKTWSNGPPYSYLSVPSGAGTCTYEYGTLSFYVDGNYDSSEAIIESVSCSY